MKKSLIALTVAGAVANYASAVDLDQSTSVGAINYASEITLVGTGVEVTTSETVTATIGFTVTPSAPRFFRYDLTNGATFVGNPTLTVPGATGIVISTGGAGQSFVLFEVSATAATVPNTTVATLSFAAASPNLGLNGSTTIQYQMFEFGALGGNGLLASAGPNTLAAFTPTLTVGTSTVTGATSTAAVEPTKLIEVAADSLAFEGTAGTTAFTSLGSLFVADVATPPFLIDGTTTASVTNILASHSVDVYGDFSFAENVFLVLDPTGGAGSTNLCENTGSPGILGGVISTLMDKVTFTPPSVFELGDVGATGVTSVVNVCVQADGETLIPEGSYSGMYMPVANAGFTVSDVAFDLNSLANTGQTIILNLGLTPRPEGGVYAQFFRVTNTSSTRGRVFFRLINDQGESSTTIDMEDVYADGVNTVPGNGSSRQFNIDDVYAAVQAQDMTFSVGDAPRKKMRIVVTGEFGSMDVQTYTVSTDETTFATFN
jgi:hypothetical protein